MHNRIIRTERGWPGHYICAHDCHFRRNTLLEYKDTRRVKNKFVTKYTRVVVSTVGYMRDGEGNVREIGYGRHYETMVFHAKKEVHGDNAVYYDADVQKEISLNSKWALSEVNSHSDNKANDMHEAVVNEIAERLSANTLKECEHEL